MPEIAEVYRACGVLRRAAFGKCITKVETIEDDLVFVGGAEKFRNTVQGQNVVSVERYGKHFFMTLSNKLSVLFHLGMSGHVQIRGEAAAAYRRKPKDPDLWPPKYWRFVFTLNDGVQFAFMDSRRFGRIKILDTPDPHSVMPLKGLGWDAISKMATYEQFEATVLKRKCPIKALLLNQKFLAGVGNWVADEVLYQSKVHPEQVCKSLSEEQIRRLYESTIYVCRFAVSVNADHNKFPQDWLFKYRWGKSHAIRRIKKESVQDNSQDALLDDESDTDVIDENTSILEQKEGDYKPIRQDPINSGRVGKTMKRADGKILHIEWVTCGGRTSAYVVGEQILPPIDEEAIKTSKTAVDVSKPTKEEEQEEEEEGKPLRDKVMAKVIKKAPTRKRKRNPPDEPVVPIPSAFNELVGDLPRRRSLRLRSKT